MHSSFLNLTIFLILQVVKLEVFLILPAVRLEVFNA